MHQRNIWEQPYFAHVPVHIQCFLLLIFDILHNMQLIKELCIQNLINKLVLLVTIISGGQLVQTICSIRVFDIKRIDNKITISIRSATKQIKTKKHVAGVSLRNMMKKQSCVMNYHTEYLKTGAATGGVLRKVVSRNFAKFTGKHLCHSLTGT